LIVAGVAAAAVLVVSLVWNEPSPTSPVAPRHETSRKTPAPPEPRPPEVVPAPPAPEPPKPTPPVTPKPEVPPKPEEPKKPDVPAPAPKPEEPPKPETPKRDTVAEKAIATLERTEGTVFKVSGASKTPARPGEGLFAGQGLETLGAKSAAVFAFLDGTRLRIEGDAAARDLRAEGGKRLGLDQGTLNAEISKQPEGQPMTLVTPHGQAAVLGTALRVIVVPSVSTRVEVREGRVQLTRKSDAKSVVLLADQAAELAEPPNGNNDGWTRYSKKVETGTFTHLTIGLKTGTRSPSGPTVGFDQLRVTPGGGEDFETMPRWDSTFEAPWGGPAVWTIEAGGQAGKFLQASRPGPGSSVRTKVFVVPARSSIDLSVFLKCPSGSPADYWIEVAFRPGIHAAKDFDLNAGEWTMIKKFDSSPLGEIEVRSLPPKK
jgi:hypothetical protein